jgi:hypothetical protein
MLARALRLAGVWLSGPALLGLAPLVLADGTRGIWPLLALVGGAGLLAVLLGAPCAAVPEGRPLLGELAALRWPAAGPLWPLVALAALVALLFLWAQLAAAGELAEALGWPRAGGIGAVALVLGLAAWRRDLGAWLGAAGAALALAGLLLPLAVVAGATDPVWPRVWDAVARRGPSVFAEDSPWVREGHPVRGPGRGVALTFADEQRVALLDGARARLEPREGAAPREVTAPAEVLVRPGDRLTGRAGLVLRFQAGHAIPGTPASGLEWAESPGRSHDWRPLLGLGVTLLAGALGLAPAHAALAGGRAGGGRIAALGAALALVGLGALALWALYAAWLAPEIYAGGVAGAEVYEVPAALPVAGVAGAALRDLAWLGVLGGAVAAGAAALAAVAAGLPAGTAPAALGVGAVLALVWPAGAWPVLLAALGLAAAGLAPAAVLGTWRERLDPGALSGGAALGGAVFGVLAALRLAEVPPASWIGWLAAWPALVALPLNALVAWLASASPRPSPRAPLAPGLAALHGGDRR